MKDKGKTPRFTIVLSVEHSEKDLGLCLDSLANLDYRKDEYRIAAVECGAVPEIGRFLKDNGPFGVLDIQVFSLPPKTLESKKVPAHLARVNEGRNKAIESLPAEYYVFTETDCTFPSDWLRKIDAHLDDRPGILGGPDVLPDKMDTITNVIDVILNSPVGTGGIRPGEKGTSKQYFPHKENMVIPAAVLQSVGKFPENNIFGAEMEMTNRILEAGYTVKYMDDNPVYHRRITSLRNFLGITSYRASEKIALLGKRISLLRVLRYLVPGVAAFLLILAILAPFFSWSRLFLGLLALFYGGIITWVSLRGALQKKSVLVGLGVFFILPLFHWNIATGVLSGILKKKAV